MCLATTTAEDILALNPDGILLSPGPGDPALLDYLIKTVKNLIGKKPIMEQYAERSASHKHHHAFADLESALGRSAIFNGFPLAERSPAYLMKLFQSSAGDPFVATSPEPSVLIGMSIFNR